MNREKSELTGNRILSFAEFRHFVVASLVLSILIGCAGQDSARVKESTGTGAAVGAGIGLLIGLLSGNPEKAAAGLAVGAAVGAGEGAYQGWKQEQDDQRTQQLVEAIKESKSTAPASTTPVDRAREELTRFIGVWQMEGWAQEPGRERLTVKAKVNGDVEMSYFVELAYIDIEIPGVETRVWGKSMLGYDQDDGYNITTRFNTLPEPVRLSGGEFSTSTRTFTFSESGFRVVIRFENPDRFTTDTFITSNGNDEQVESYRFTRN